MHRTDDGFEAIYAAHHREALRVAYLLTGDADLAEDAVAEAFLRVYRAWRAGGVEHPRAYLRRAVVNEVHSRFRRFAVERREAARQRGDARGALAVDESVVESEAMLAALRRLPARQRTAIVLRYYADATEAEIAEVMGIAPGTVKSATHRGMAMLRRLLEQPAVQEPAARRVDDEALAA
jgi:RNA polymerase sigma-70 factor (sigma-E family)